MCVCRGVDTRREAVMGGNFIVCDHPVSSGSGAMVGERAGSGLDGEFSSHTVGNFIPLQASVRRSPDDFYGGSWGCLLENFFLKRNKARGEILNCRFRIGDECGRGRLLY